MSNFASIQVDLPDQQNPQYCQNFPIVAEIVKIVRVEQGYTIVALRDFSGVENTALIRGRVKPTYPEIGQIHVFNLAGKTKDGRIGYSGFYNPQDPIPSELVGKRTPAPTQGQGAPAGQGGAKYSPAGSGRNIPDAGKNRGVALSYAKDLAVAGKISLGQIIGSAVAFAKFIENGAGPARVIGQPQQSVEQVQQPVQQPVEREVAETGFDGVGTGPQESYTDQNQDPYGKTVVQGAANATTGVQGNTAPWSDEDIPF